MIMMKLNYDITEKIGNSIINHGKYNNRIYLMKLKENEDENIIPILDNMAKENRYTKIFAKVPYSLKERFINAGYNIEATIEGVSKENGGTVFMGKYFSKERASINNEKEIKNIIEVAFTKNSLNKQGEIAKEYEFHICSKQDSEEIAKVYKEVFETYPFPIHQATYIEKTMEENLVYFSIKHKGKIVALSSTEMDYSSKSVEMTDFATLPQYRGNGFSLFLLDKMEEKMIQQNFYMAYTIARAISYGMNITFSKSGYKYGGTLINNTNISGDLESMNVWYKPLTKRA
jgi:putative beta-lysine N-acetyltransferase